MDKRLKELAEQAGFEEQTHFIDSWECGIKELERFAELVRADEREACAALCDDWFAGTAAVDIRARGEK
jgi:hypothetical protein